MSRAMPLHKPSRPALNLPSVRLQTMYLSGGMSAERTRALMADGNDDIVLQLQQSGERIVSQRGREATAAAGSGLFLTNADTSAVILPGPSRSVGIAHNLDGDVSVTALALRQQVTPRYIQKLFESEGSTLSRYVLGQRLARCIAG
jgi:hypothetical protein